MVKMGLVTVIAMLLHGATPAQELVWKEKAELPRPVAGYMGGVSQGKLLIVGGSYWDNKQKHWSDLVQAFDPLANQWTNEAPLPRPRSDAASATLDGDLYIFGGGSTTDVRRDALVLRAGEWSSVPQAELPAPRLYATAVQHADSVYLLGGMANAGDYKHMANSFWRWRPGEKSWEVLPPLPGPGRINHAMAEIGNEIYVFGGAGTGPVDVENLKDAYRFDPVKKQWTRLPDLPVANRSWWAVGLGDRAVVLAGYTNDYAREVYVYDPQDNLEFVGLLPHGLADAKFCRIGDVLVGTGGEAGPGIRGKWTLEAEIPKAWLSRKK